MVEWLLAVTQALELFFLAIKGLLGQNEWIHSVLLVLGSGLLGICFGMVFTDPPPPRRR